jgi:hypothetical protein
MLFRVLTILLFIPMVDWHGLCPTLSGGSPGSDSTSNGRGLAHIANVDLYSNCSGLSIHNCGGGVGGTGEAPGYLVQDCKDQKAVRSLEV